MAKSKKTKKKLYSGIVQIPFTVKNHQYKVGDVYTSEHEHSVKYLITIKNLK